MASSLPQYQNPADIRIYGRMVDKFSKAAKAFAGYARIGKKGEKRTANLPDSNAESIAGEGRYNSQSELPSYIIYGPKKRLRRAAKIPACSVASFLSIFPNYACRWMGRSCWEKKDVA